MIRLFLIAASLFLALQASTQTLTMPPEIQKTYTNGTRSVSGKPGKNYWQNHARYNISLTVMPPESTVKGAEQIVYTNNSPDTLRSLNMKLIMNVHRDAGGMKVDEMMIGDRKADWNNDKAVTTN